ncbi:SixA phosphatase family protein [Rhodospirillum sp. A1_3_36]|uniref:SixA phosphatase family protein n=1 Tax=Rhodospirillum sp. A1_3_36 TaxID=3391666 RepID=UPI0039A62C4F
MKRLLFLRHAKSDWGDPGLDDFERPLAHRGIRACALIADHLARASVAPDLVLCSAARRTRETLDLVKTSLTNAPVLFEREIYVFEHRPLLARLRRLEASANTVMVIGHNPALEELSLSLAGPDSDAEALAAIGQKFPTGALVDLTFDGPWSTLAPGEARLSGFTRPRDLRSR